MSHDPRHVLMEALERLRRRHLAFRRAEPDEMSELEAMRLEIVKAETETQAATSDLTHLRLRLAERAYHVLRLELFANAIENEGWMNLFRLWAREEDKSSYQKLKLTLSPPFRAFYEMYIQGYAATPEKPIPHPWLKTDRGLGSGLFMDSGRTEPPFDTTSVRGGTGGVDDSKGRAAVDQTYEKPSDGSEGESGSSAPGA